MSQDIRSAWPLQIRLKEIRAGSTPRRFDAAGAEREAIARSLDLLTLPAFTASVRLAPWRDGVQVSATWSATVVRACSLTLESFESDLRGVFDVKLAPEAAPVDAALAEIVIDPEDEDPPDRLEGDAVPVGALLVEHLALELDPFPRSPNARFEPPPEPAEPSPFAALARLARPPD